MFKKETCSCCGHRKLREFDSISTYKFLETPHNYNISYTKKERKYRKKMFRSYIWDDEIEWDKKMDPTSIKDFLKSLPLSQKERKQLYVELSNRQNGAQKYGHYTSINFDWCKNLQLAQFSKPDVSLSKYNTLFKTDLKEELKARGFNNEGLKKDLIIKLEALDKELADEID